MTIEEARKLVVDPLYLGCLIIKNGDADGQLAGARNTTGNVLRPALQIIKTSPGITCVSGAMLLLTHAPEYGKNGILVMGDVAVTPVPDAEQLAQIAVCTARTAQAVAGLDPKVAIILILGIGALAISAVGSLLGGWFIWFISKGRYNPAIGIAGVSCLPTTAKIAQKEVNHENPYAIILPLAMGAGVSGLIVSAIATGIFISTLFLLN